MPDPKQTALGALRRADTAWKRQGERAADAMERRVECVRVARQAGCTRKEIAAVLGVSWRTIEYLEQPDRLSRRR